MNDFFSRLPQHCRHIRNLCKSTPDGQLFEMLAEETGLMAQSRPAMEREFKLPVEVKRIDWRFEDGRFVPTANQPRIGIGWYAETYRPPNSCPSNHDLTRAGCNVFVLEDIGLFQDPGVNCVLVPMLQDAAQHLDTNLPGQFWDVWWAAHYRDWPWSDGWTKSSWWEKSQETKREFLNEFRRDVRRVLKTWIGWCEGAVYKSYRTRFDELIVTKPRLSVTKVPQEVTLGDKTYDLTDEQFDYLVEIIEAKGIPVGMRNDLRSHPKRIFETFPPAIQAVIIVTNKGVAIDTSKVDI